MKKSPLSNQTPNISWKKVVATIYYLLIAYKKTMRVKLNYYFNNNTNIQFFLAVSPFVAYFIQLSLEKYDFKYQQTLFFNKSLPGLKRPFQELSWETYAYTKYVNKLNSNFINKVTSMEDCFFISLNSHWQFKQKQLSTGTFESLNSTTNWSFLPSRYFYQLLNENQKQELNELCLQDLKNSLLDSHKKKRISSSEIRFWKNFLVISSEGKQNFELFNKEENIQKNKVCSEATNREQKPAFFEENEKDPKNFQTSSPYFLTGKNLSKSNLQSLESLKKKFSINTRWQIFFNELDDIPTKLNSVFQPTEAFSKDFSKITKPLLLFSMDDFSFTEISLISSNLHITSTNNQSVVENFEFLNQNLSNIQRNVNKEFEKALKNKETFVSLNNNLLEETLRSNKSNRLYPNHFIAKPIKVNSNLLKKNLTLLNKTNLIGLEINNFNRFQESNQNWIPFLTQIFKTPLLKNEPILFLERNFQYNLEFGFSQLSKLLKTNVLTHNENRIIERNKTISNKIFDLENQSITQKTLHELQSYGESDQKKLHGPKEALRNSQNKNSFSHQISSFEIVPKSVSLIWQKSLREDLRRPVPVWVKVLKNQNKALKLKTDTPSFLVQIANFENLFANQFQFDFFTTNVLSKKPESILKLIKKTNYRSPAFQIENEQTEQTFIFQNFIKKFTYSTNQKTLSPKLFLRNCGAEKKTAPIPTRRNLNFAVNSILLNNEKRFSQVQRKLSGYLYPDNFRKTVFKNLSHFNIKFNNPKRMQKSSTKRYDQEFSNLVLPSLFYKEKNTNGILEFSTKEEPCNSLIQIYPPLIQTSLNFKDNFLIESKQSDNLLNVEKLQKKSNSLNTIEPDQSFTVKKDFFFGIPADSPVYGLTLKEYKEKYEPRKKEFQKNNLISPYDNSLNFLIQAKSNLLQKNVLNEELSNEIQQQQQNNLVDNILENSSKLTKKKSLTEMGKSAIFSTKIFETDFFNNNEMQKNQKTFQFQQPLISYKTHFNYTKSRFLNNSLWKSKIDTFLIKSTFSSNLYEPISLKSWTLLSQLGFVFIFLKLIGILYNEYREEMGYYINEFAVFLNEYEKTNFLDFFNPKENFRVIKKTNKKFSDLVDGRFLLTEFGEVILLLRSSRKFFSKIGISKPHKVFFDPPALLLRYKVFTNFTNFNNNLLIERKVFIQKKIHILKENFTEKLKRQEAFVEKPNLKLENFIPKGILLIGPPGTGKTLLVKALSGEASVPVVVESGKMLTTNMENNGAERLKDLFKAAREMAPCILFLDEVDTIGQKRENVISTLAYGEKENKIPNTLNLIYFQNGLIEKLNEKASSFNLNLVNPVLNLQSTKNSISKKNQEFENLKTQITNQKISNVKQQHQDLIMLTQLLCELDGLSNGQNGQEIIVIGATNRPATLDSALTRPGRFGKVIYLDLPGKQKRCELLKFYSHSKTLRYFKTHSESSFFIKKPFTDFGSFLPLSSNFRLTNFDQTILNSQNFLKLTLNKGQHFISFFKNLVNSNMGLSSQAPEKQFYVNRSNLSIQNEKEIRNSTGKKSFLKNPNLDQTSIENFSKKQAKKENFLYPLSEPNSYKFEKIVGVDNNINWNYFANQTVGLSAAHLEAAMNRSALKAISTYRKSQSSGIRLGQVFGEEKFLNSFSLLYSENPNLSSSDKLRQKINQLDDLSIKQNTLVNLSKQSKLRTLTQSGVGTIETLNYLTLSFEKSSEQKFKNQPIHNFETIEYGIQTVSTLNTSFQIKLTKVQKINKKILGQLSQEDLVLKIPNFNNKVQFEKPSKLRQSFYQNHRPYLRTLALLGVISQTKQKTIITPKLNKLPFDKSKTFRSSTLMNLKIVAKSLNRIIKNGFFGWILLFNSTCLIKNSLFEFSIQTQNQKNLNYIYYDLLSLNKSFLKVNRRTLLKWEDFNSLNQTSLFGDSFFINRSAYYLTGKFLLNFTNCFEKENDQPISLWAFTGSIQARQKNSVDSKVFLTKIQFENFLLSLIAGKATESLILANQLAAKKKNDSNIGIDELKQLGAFMELMENKCLFYSEKQLTRKQFNINLTENEKQINQEEFIFLKELASFFEMQTKTLTDLSGTHFKFSDQFKSIDQPWWQFNSIHLLSSLNLKYGEWYRLFLAEEQQNFRNIEWVAPDTYFHNQINNAHLASTQNNFRSPNLNNVHYFFNRELCLKSLLFSKLNWNQVQLLESEPTVSYFIFESFNKIFILLENNRELLDSLAYSLLCHESLREFEIRKIYRRYFK